MDSIKDVLSRKADDLDASAKLDDLGIIQAELDRHFDGKVRAKKINDNGVVIVQTRSSSLASEVRFKQHQLTQQLNHQVSNTIKRFQIRIA